MFSYSLVHTSFEAIDFVLREAINGVCLIDRTSYDLPGGKVHLWISGP